MSTNKQRCLNLLLNGYDLSAMDLDVAGLEAEML